MRDPDNRRAWIIGICGIIAASIGAVAVLWSSPNRAPDSSRAPAGATATAAASPDSDQNAPGQATQDGAQTAPTNGSSGVPPSATSTSPTVTLMLTAGSYDIERQIYADSDVVIMLTTITVSDSGIVRANLTYRDVGDSPTSLACSTATDPSVDTLTSFNGTIFLATHSHCSDDPTYDVTLPPGGISTSYAIFSSVRNVAGPFSLTWQIGHIYTGTVSGIQLAP